MPAGGREPNWMPVFAGGWEPSYTPGGGGIKNSSLPGSAMVHDGTVADEDVDVLECGICYRPLKPPIFQCAKGHVVCSLCSARLKDAVKCHVCRVTMPGGYQWCHTMERVVDSVRMPCPHAPYGCDMRTAYHAQEQHLLECPHAPCRCPDDTCGFASPVATLVTHLKAVHVHRRGQGWRVLPHRPPRWLHFLIAVGGSAWYLLLLNMASTPFGHAISVVWISSLAPAMASSSSAPATSKNMTCELELYFMLLLKHGHYQKSRFQVECMCPSNGLPDPNASFQFFIPKYADGNEALVRVTATIII